MIIQGIWETHKALNNETQFEIIKQNDQKEAYNISSTKLQIVESAHLDNNSRTSLTQDCTQFLKFSIVFHGWIFIADKSGKFSNVPRNVCNENPKQFSITIWMAFDNFRFSLHAQNNLRMEKKLNCSRGKLKQWKPL